MSARAIVRSKPCGQSDDRAVVCPFCGHRHTSSDEPFSAAEEDGEIVCVECAAPFMASRRVTVNVVAAFQSAIRRFPGISALRKQEVSSGTRPPGCKGLWQMARSSVRGNADSAEACRGLIRLVSSRKPRLARTLVTLGDNLSVGGVAFGLERLSTRGGVETEPRWGLTITYAFR